MSTPTRRKSFRTPPIMRLRMSDEENETETRVPLRLQITPDDSESDDRYRKSTLSANDEMHVIDRLRSAIAPVIVVGSHRHDLTYNQARDIATTMFLAQQLIRSDGVRYYLVLGGNLTMPANQLDMISRARLTAVIVAPDLSSLAMTPYDPTDTESFTLACRFVVGNAAMTGVPVSQERFPIVPSRPNATPIAWAAFNPAVHSEVPIPNRSLVVFENTPNRLLHGDSVTMTATRKTNFGLVGTVPAEQTSQSSVIAVNSLYFFRNEFPEMTALDSKAYNLYNATWPGGAVADSSVNIEINYREPISPQRLTNAIDALQKHVFTAEQVNALMRAIIVEKKIII